MKECLFDPNHGPWESAIAQDDRGGPLTYQCFHESCKDYTWHDARSKISGTAPINHFFVKEDGTKPPREMPAGGMTVAKIEGLRLPALRYESADPELPPPLVVKPEIFFDADKKKRPTYNYQKMVQYLWRFFGPIFCTDKIFWRYTDGVYTQVTEDSVRQVILVALKEQVQPNWMNGTLELFQGFMNKDRTPGRWKRITSTAKTGCSTS